MLFQKFSCVSPNPCWKKKMDYSRPPLRLRLYRITCLTLRWMTGISPLTMDCLLHNSLNLFLTTRVSWVKVTMSVCPILNMKYHYETQARLASIMLSLTCVLQLISIMREIFWNISSKKSLQQNGAKTRSFVSCSNRSIDKISKSFQYISELSV